ncbi:MAG TPA: hypothetical protein VGF19_06610 [Candidatus Acidoferrum sp.]|jgi:hypothetical protein
MQDDRNILELLKAELAFLEKGGYRKGPRYPWRPTFMFEDSPTCINFQSERHPRPCGECALIQFVPEDRKKLRYPCRHIQLTSQGECVNSFYEWGTQEELEVALKAWLQRTIQAIEHENKSKSQSA